MAENPQSLCRQEALDRWRRILAGSGRTIDSGLQANPAGPAFLSLLLAQAHAPAARAIGAPDIPVFRASIPPRSSFLRGQDSRTLRVSFGIFATIGEWRMVRVTVYHVEPFGRSGARAGKDLLWDSSPELLCSWNGVEPVPRLGIAGRANVVVTELRRWFVGFQSSGDFLTWQKQCVSKYEEEKRQLSLLYNDNSLSQKIGLRDEPGGYQATIEDEYWGRMLDLTERYEASFRAVTLSIAEIRCNGLRLKSGAVKLPFLSGPL